MDAYAQYIGLKQHGARTARVFDVLVPGGEVRAMQYLGEHVVLRDHPYYGLRPTHGPVARAVREATTALLDCAGRQQGIRDALTAAGVR